MKAPLGLIVSDTSPLITLALADSLDLLLRPGVQVAIPDAVYVEATRIKAALGAQQIVDWINSHSELVRIAPTDTGVDQQRRIDEGRSIRGLGETSAIEVLDRFLESRPEAEALLLFEDTDLEKRRALMDVRVSVISTGDFLRELEAAGVISSADTLLDLAAQKGRTIDRQRRGQRGGEDYSLIREQLKPKP